MEKGDLVAIYMQGEAVLFCVIGLYQREDDGEIIAVLAMIDPKQLRQIPLEILQDNKLDAITLIH